MAVDVERDERDISDISDERFQSRANVLALGFEFWI
jgi:hypothetical protein